MFRPTHRGFTLIELMVALAIAASLFAALVLGLGALTGARARKAMGELGAAARSLYDTAALTGNTCRLVLLLPRDDSAEFAYRAECASGPVTSAMDRDQEIRDATKAAIEAYGRKSRGGARATEPAPDPKAGLTARMVLPALPSSTSSTRRRPGWRRPRRTPPSPPPRSSRGR